MQKYFYIGLILSSCHISALNAAAQIYQCTASNGATTFSDRSCPGTSTQSLHTLVQPMTIPALPANSNQRPVQHTRVTIIADDKHPCGTFDSSTRRTHLVRKQVTSGMSQAEVESMFGKPLTQSNHNGIISATYRSAKNQKRSVRFNQNGCVP
ncbi:DUF4124 domain-containing protein [Denitrificimonas caeni]|uniref:DUF4124 domain-containing protein n=1 Tax=Denitrificimonas caeni TaxID=521720 RepID=UPI001962CEEF|nr:DUF4124 domain-containing protein [Denitrificimonas caeni]